MNAFHDGYDRREGFDYGRVSYALREVAYFGLSSRLDDVDCYDVTAMLPDSRYKLTESNRLLVHFNAKYDACSAFQSHDRSSPCRDNVYVLDYSRSKPKQKAARHLS
jgi:hypothetical protein